MNDKTRKVGTNLIKVSCKNFTNMVKTKRKKKIIISFKTKKSQIYLNNIFKNRELDMVSNH